MMQNERPEQDQTEDIRQAEDAAGQEPAAETVPPEAEPETLDEAPEPEAPEVDLQAELEETRERLLRTLAETENLRRRHARELEEARKYAITGFARDMLDIADNLNRALASIPEKAKEKIDLIKNLADGVSMTEKMLLGAFERHQVAKVHPEVGEKFDHNRHQAMFEVATDEQAPGTVAQVVQPGYVIADRLLRPAMVGVAKAGGSPKPADDEGAGGQGEPSGEPGERIDTTA